MQAEPDLRDWIGRTQTVADTATPAPYAALSATLDWPVERPPAGTPLPALWHWLYFLPLYRQSEAGPDGHAKRGEFLPPVPLPRRMWAGSQVTFPQVLRVGEALERRSTITDVSEKSGRSGRLVFVKLRHDVYGASAGSRDNDPAIIEYQDIVYREAAKPEDRPPPPQAAPLEAAWKRTIRADEVLLFRYSALTFNSHRIHYDRKYVTEVEGYAGLVVHGPLIATLLLDLLRRELPQARVVKFDFRAMRPLVDIHPFAVCGQPLDASPTGGKRFRLWAEDHEGWLTMDATVEIA